MSEFNLIIEFGGMCLFVPHGNQVKVLMPKVDHATHEPRLFVHEKYFLTPGQIASAKLDKFGDLYAIPLQNLDVAFTGRGGRADAASLKGKNLAPISKHLGSSPDHRPKDKVLKRLLTGPLQSPVASRVALGAGGMVTSTCSGPWTMGGIEERAIAISAEWRLEGVARFPAEVPFDLAPPPNETMRVHIFNTVESDNPNAAPEFFPSCGPADHFSRFYPAFGVSKEELKWRDVPLYGCAASDVESRPGKPHEREHDDHRQANESILGRRLSCLMGDGDPEEP